MRVEIYGYSDDLVEVRVDGRDKHEFGAFISGNGVYACALIVQSIGGAHVVRVHAIYDGCWSFAVGQVEEDHSLPEGWEFGVEQEHGYSVRLWIQTGAEQVVVSKEGSDA